MQLQIRILFKTLVLPLCLAASFHNARANDRVALCQALAPSEPQELSESFKGKVEGKLSGVLSKLAGGLAQLEGEYNRVSKDTLKDLPEAHKLYFWQRLIYLACVDDKSNLDLNELSRAYLVGPPGLDLTQKTKKSDIQMEFLGLDSVASAETLSMHDVPGFQSAHLPDLVFSFTNVSQAPVHVQLDECSLVNFRYPEPIPINTFRQSAGQAVSTVSGTTLMKAIGPYSVIVPPGQKKAKSYGITSVDPLAFDDRARGSSYCRFRIGTETIMQSVDVAISSPARYVSR